MIRCPNCNKEILPTWNICPFCEYKPKLCSKDCSNCWLPNDAHFCPQCGSPVRGEEKYYLKDFIKHAILKRIGDDIGSGVKKDQNGMDGELAFIVHDVSFDMIAVKGGTFTMGGTSEQGINVESDEQPLHSVTLSDYYIGKYEVTQELWQAIMGDNPSYCKGNNLPVESVSWNDVQKFIDKLNWKTGRCFSLPTEAEWEYAARGGNISRGYKYSGSNNIWDVAWFNCNSGSNLNQVGSKLPNELGIYDMCGNVWEWCQDWYCSYSKYSKANPMGTNSGYHRVRRGGSWYSNECDCRISKRSKSTPNSSSFNCGFRIVLHK